MTGRDSADKFQFIKNSNVENIILVSLSRAGVDYQCPSPVLWCRCSISMSSLLTVPDFKDPGPTNLALLKCRGGQTQPRLLTHISIQATNLTSCLFDMIKHETSRADVKSSRSLSFNKLLIEKYSHYGGDTGRARWEEGTVQMSTLQTSNI